MNLIMKIKTSAAWYVASACLVLLCLAVSGMAADKTQTTPILNKPLKIFLLAGQSNMEGHALLSTLPGIRHDPITKPLYDKLVDDNGQPRVFKQVDIVNFGQVAFKKDYEELKKRGKLTVGFGGNGYRPEMLKFGPELAFGATMYESLNEPFLIIKTAWGGKSLHYDFRPPSAPRLEDENAGHYYRLMVSHIHSVLKDLPTYCPAYNPEHGYEIAGFVWFQGFNDFINNQIYPGGNEGKPGAYNLYTNLLTQFIKDIRAEFKTPNMPFVIGALGIDGVNAQPRIIEFRKAMAAPALLPEFKETVAAVETAQFWDDKLADLDKKKRQKKPLTPEEEQYLAENLSNKGFHYLGSGKIYSKIGEAFANAMAGLLKQ